MKIYGLLLTLYLLMLLSCGQQNSETNLKDEKMSAWMAKSEMKAFTNLGLADFTSRPVWGYTQGVVGKGMIDLTTYTGDSIYWEYVESFLNEIIKEDGTIKGYDSTDYNIDEINAGKLLFPFYKATGDEKYRIAIESLRDQMRNHPRTSEGGFWHKKRYPHQMWLDGIYMGSPFLAQYAVEFNEPALFDDVANQIRLIAENTYDSAAGLFHHAWDESGNQQWSNKETGRSSTFWGRSVGWFGMAMVDVLDYMPKDHPDRPEIIRLLRQVAEGIERYQDEKSGVWYQVLDQGTREGNYLEATASSMFVYVLYKGVREGYLDDKYLQVANKGYHGILDTFIKENGDGTISLTRCCAVAGLGGDPYRDGSFEYYISEPIRDNDPKGVGPFIMASIEYEKLNKNQ